jgi:hypothetical protein
MEIVEMDDCIDYKKMWETLKKRVKSDKECYAKGVMCSMAESSYGEEVCEDILKYMETIERKAGIGE